MEVNFTVTTANPVTTGNIISHDLTSKVGTVRFWGTAVDTFSNDTFNFDVTRNINMLDTQGIFEYSTADHNYRKINFLIPGPPPSPPIRASFLYTASRNSSPVVSVTFIMPSPFNLGYLDNIYDVPGSDDFQQTCFFAVNSTKYTLLPGETTDIYA